MVRETEDSSSHSRNNCEHKLSLTFFAEQHKQWFAKPESRHDTRSAITMALPGSSKPPAVKSAHKLTSWLNQTHTHTSGEQTRESFNKNTTIRFENAAGESGEFTCLQPKWKKSVEEERGWEGEDRLEGGEEEDLKQEENVWEEKDQIWQIKFIHH